MTDKKYKVKNYYECPQCAWIWSDIFDTKDALDNCPECEFKNVKPMDSYENLLDWTEHYTPIRNRIERTNENRFETYGEELMYVQTYDQNHVWTVFEDDYGEMSICKGMRRVNRQYFILSKESHENDDEHYYW